MSGLEGVGSYIWKAVLTHDPPPTDLCDAVTMGENDVAEGTKPWSRQPTTQKRRRPRRVSGRW
jgi:hypothetical protein